MLNETFQRRPTHHQQRGCAAGPRQTRGHGFV